MATETTALPKLYIGIDMHKKSWSVRIRGNISDHRNFWVSEVKVIGSQTAGADGNVSSIVLPDGISTMISGIGIFYPNGTPTQKIGVKIDYLSY